jgi:hypothetical protein
LLHEKRDVAMKTKNENLKRVEVSFIKFVFSFNIGTIYFLKDAVFDGFAATQTGLIEKKFSLKTGNGAVYCLIKRGKGYEKL